jgi:hypothetical protein
MRLSTPFHGLLCALSFLFAVSCGTSTSSLIGTYSVEENGKLNEFIRIEQQNSKYIMAEKRDGKWLEPMEVKLIGKAELQELIKEPVTVDVVGVSTNSAALFKVPKGWKSHDFESKTGYWLGTVIGPVELHKR